MDRPTRMHAIRKVRADGGADATRLDEIDVPIPGDGEVLLKVLATAMCGTDRHIYHWDPSIAHIIRPPRTYGHEFCGEVAEVGPNPGRDDLQPGDYVSAEMHVVCGTCRACRADEKHACEKTRILGLHDDGCFAQWVKVPAANIVALDRQIIPPRIGAFLDALGNAVHTTDYAPLSGRTVAVLGYGPIGAMVAAIALHEGAEAIYVLDVNPRAIERAEQWKKSKNALAVHVIEITKTTDVVSEVRRLNGGGVDAVYEMSGAETAINSALAMCRSAGHVALLGLPRGNAIELRQYSRDLIFKGLHIQAIIGRRIFATWQRMLRLLHEGLDVAFLVSEEHSGLEHFHAGMSSFDRGDALKVVYYPHGHPDELSR